jgi:hypothetical protein
MKRICGEIYRVASEAALEDAAKRLKPALLVLNVRPDEVFV